MPRSQGRTGRPWRRDRAYVKRTQRVCHICGKSIDLSLKWPDPMSFSVDHVEPLSHRPDLARDRANLRAAHLGCNRAKGSGDGGNIVVTSRNW